MKHEWAQSLQTNEHTPHTWALAKCSGTVQSGVNSIRIVLSSTVPELGKITRNDVFMTSESHESTP